MKPYYQDDYCTIYHGDCREILPDIPDVDLVLTDPPYGINYRSHHNSSRRGKFAKWIKYDNFPGIIGDDKPFDPSAFLGYPSLYPEDTTWMIFGGNYCANHLPPSGCWITWDKRTSGGEKARSGVGPNNQADCELIWTNLQKPSRVFRHLWSGIIRDGEANVARSPKLHPNQKPVEFMRWLIEFSDTKGTIVDFYLGSGSTLRAAKDLQRKAIGIEIEEKYCEIAAKRLAQEVLAL